MGFSVIWFAILALTPINLAFRLKSGGFSSPNIIGGSDAHPHSYPHQVLLQIQRGLFAENTQCGGSLISPEWVVSAAHCGKDAKIIFAILGAHDIRQYEPTQQMRLVGKFIAHPSYNHGNNLDNDIALFKLDESVAMSSNVQPIRLPSWSQRNAWFWRYSAIVTGWGMDCYDSEKDVLTTLQSVHSKVVTNIYCGYCYGFAVVKNSHICVDGSVGKATCKGDSGGPMVTTESDGKYTLIGITLSSIGKTTQEQSLPMIFTRVTSYLEWISKATGIPIRK